jgi:hypothetical protein
MKLALTALVMTCVAGCDTVAETLVAPKLTGEWTGTALCGDNGVVNTKATFGEARGGKVMVNFEPGPGAAGLIPIYGGAAEFSAITFEVSMWVGGQWEMDGDVWVYNQKGTPFKGQLSTDFTTISGPSYYAGCTRFTLKRS